MFLASGVDLYEDPCPIVVVDKTGAVVECRYSMRSPQTIASSLQEIASSREKIMFCALTEENAQEFPEFVEHLHKAHIVVKNYWFADILRIKNTLSDIRSDLPLSAYALARLLQNEALDLCTFQDEIKELYRLRGVIDRILLSLMTRRAFPEEYRILRTK